MKGTGVFRTFHSTPLRLLETVIAVTSLISAAYFFTPLYAIGRAIHPTPLTMVLTSAAMSWLWAAVLAVGAILILYGLYRNLTQFRSAGFFLLFLARLYQVIAIFIVAGPIPLQWLAPLTLGLICLVLRSAVKRGQA